MTRKTYCGNLLWQSGLTLLALLALKAYVEAVKDVLKAVGAGVSSFGTRLISVPILLCPVPVVNPMTTKDGGLVS